MLELEREATIARLAKERPAFVLAVQDTTSFNFAHHPATKGLGVIEDNRSAGFFAHTTLAVSAEGVPIGLFAQEVWTRAKSKGKVKNAHQARSISEKESQKWLNGLYDCEASPVSIITVADREGDVYELFQEVQNRQSEAVIRLKSNRLLASDETLFEHLQALPFVGRYEVAVSRQRGQEARLAQVSLRYTTVTLLPPKNRKKSLQVIPLSPLTVQVIEVLEVNAPAGTEALHWLLLTTLPVASFEEAHTIVRFYSYRWLVERFHYVLKSGCDFEDSQLETYHALTNLLALLSHQAWQILELTYQARVQPDASCELCLTVEQWQALQAFQNASPSLETACPSLAQASLWIAKLGGFVGRKGDGQPGVKVLWRGWRRLQDLVEMWKLFHPPKDVGNV